MHVARLSDTELSVRFVDHKKTKGHMKHIMTGMCMLM